AVTEAGAAGPAGGARRGRADGRSRGFVAGARVDGPVGLLGKPGDPPLAAARGRLVVADGAGGEAGGELARLRAAHSVGDGEERRRDDVLVLVPAPLLAGVGAVPYLRDHP